MNERESESEGCPKCPACNGRNWSTVTEWVQSGYVTRHANGTLGFVGDELEECLGGETADDGADLVRCGWCESWFALRDGTLDPHAGPYIDEAEPSRLTAGRAEALVEDLRRWADDRATRREAGDDSNTVEGIHTGEEHAYRQAAKEIEDRLLDTDADDAGDADRETGGDDA